MTERPFFSSDLLQFYLHYSPPPPHPKLQILECGTGKHQRKNNDSKISEEIGSLARATPLRLLLQNVVTPKIFQSIISVNCCGLIGTFYITCVLYCYKTLRNKDTARVTFFLKTFTLHLNVQKVLLLLPYTRNVEFKNKKV